MAKTQTFWVILVVIAGMAASAMVAGCNLEIAGSFGGGSNKTVEELPPEFNRLAEVWALLEAEHINGNNLDASTLSEGAIRGMLQALDDPYASYLNAEQFRLETQDFRGYFEGIGAQVAMRDGQLTIIAPIPDTPAERSGIRPGDVILSINGESTANITLLEAVSKIRGEQGTEVELLVQHLDAENPVTIVVERGVIPLHSVHFNMREDGIGYLRISNFSDGTNEEVRDALRELNEAQGVGLILDLRNNPGGLLRSVVDVASQFLDDGLVLYEMDAQGNRNDWQVKSGGDGRTVPIVVLVNQFSASASEVLTGALMDHQRATVVGVTTFGKGSVNTMRPLSDGSGVYFTIAHWFTPGGTLIETSGVTPDVIVEGQPDGVEDVQLDRAIEILREKIDNVG